MTGPLRVTFEGRLQVLTVEGQARFRLQTGGGVELNLSQGEGLCMGDLLSAEDWDGKLVTLTVEEWRDPIPKCQECGGDLGGL